MQTDALVWIDCEMTGLDPNEDALVEIAVIVTDAELKPLDDGLDIVIATDPAKLAGMDDVVREMHTASGLLDAIADATTSLEQAEDRSSTYVKRYVPERRKAPLCGNTIATDRGVPRPLHAAAGRPPALPDDRRLHDQGAVPTLVSAGLLQRACQGRRASRPRRHPESINELRYYRATVLVPPPGPDTDAARRRGGRGRRPCPELGQPPTGRR